MYMIQIQELEHGNHAYTSMAYGYKRGRVLRVNVEDVQGLMRQLQLSPATITAIQGNQQYC